MQFQLLSFRGSSRMQEMARGLVEAGQETHFWCAGDSSLPSFRAGGEYFHRWRQRVPHAGERAFSALLVPYLIAKYVRPRLARGLVTAVLAEEKHGVATVFQLDWLLRRAGLRERVAIFWHTSSAFGFDRVDAERLASAATITTVSRCMRRQLQGLGVDSVVIPNGLGTESYTPVPARQVYELAGRVTGRVLLVKLADWVRRERWLQALAIVAELRRLGRDPLLIAQGGNDTGRRQVLAYAYARGLRVGVWDPGQTGAAGLVELVSRARQLDLLVLDSALDPGARRLLFRGAHAVLADGAHEPFGQVGLEAMAARGLVYSAGSSEEYVVSKRNALVLRTGDAAEFLRLFAWMSKERTRAAAIRRAAQRTSLDYAWPEIVARTLLPPAPSHATVSVAGGGPSGRASGPARSADRGSRMLNVEP